MSSPLAQFSIENLTAPLFTVAGYDIAFTNSALFMFLAVGAVIALTLLAMRPRALVPGRWQMLVEKIHNFIAGLLDEAAGEKSRPFMPLVFTVFLFIFSCNILGMIPHSLTVTGQLVVNLALALFIFAIIIVTGFVRHGWHFFRLFLPSGVPVLLIPFMIPIEIVSFFVRPFSLSIRLFANMMAGHVLLKVIGGMTASVITAGGLAAIGILPLVLNVAITGFEFFVAFLQAYIFTILVAVYLRDALELH